MLIMKNGVCVKKLKKLTKLYVRIIGRWRESGN